MDFNLVSQIERSVDINSMKSGDLLVEHILKYQKSEKHYNMIMMIIPNIMSTGNIDKCFMEFFCFNNNPDIKQCNLEMVINNKDLP